VAWSPRWTSWSRRNQAWRFYRVTRLLFTTLWVLVRERSRVLRAHARGHYGVQPDLEALHKVIVDFRETAVALGGLMIKLGQFLSTRADLLPQEALEELALLQDTVPPEPFSAIRQVLEEELGAPIDSVFSYIDPVPAGSASLGQVHRARLRTGLDVAIKVQRPGVDRLVHLDLNTLEFALGIVRVINHTAERALDSRRLLREFSRIVYEELDYRQEGHNAEKFAHHFGDTDDVRVPSIIWEHSTKRVLVLGWVDGIKIGDTAALDRAGINRRAVAERLLHVYLTQLLQHGFYHADPHPGNIFVRPRPEGFELVFVDFGMTGTIGPSDRRLLTTGLLAIVQQDAAMLVSALDALGFLGPGSQKPALEQSLAALMGRYASLTMEEVRSMDTGEMMEDIDALLYGQQFRLPYQFAFVGRAVGTLSGLFAQLAPEFNFMEAALPYTRQYVVRGGVSGVLQLIGVQSVNELGRLVLREGLTMARTATSLPRLAERVLERVESGELRLVIDSHNGTGSSHSRTIADRTINRPVPAWVPLGMVGAAAAVAVTVWRRTNNHQDFAPLIRRKR
jgi:predicted unusual protein kinase regulating ubiquinone biosynthesis (AarF/ABC1/UbiB family)